MTTGKYNVGADPRKLPICFRKEVFAIRRISSPFAWNFHDPEARQFSGHG
jgi:hypothetical protein